MQKLQTLCIKLVHRVPLQHRIELTGSQVPSQKDKKLFVKHGPLRKGPFSPMEDAIITRNWETFCEVNSVHVLH